MISPIFVELISLTNLSQHSDKNDYFFNKVTSLQSQHSTEKSTDWLCDTFSTMRYYDLINDPEFALVLNDIKTDVIKFSKEYGVQTENINCSDAWINLASPGAYQEYHIHSGSHFSIAYYLKTPENCGNIVFRSHEANTDMFPLPADGLLPPNFKTFYYTPKTNDLLIFRSNLSHMVEKNKSKEDRVSISANFGFAR